MPESCALTSSHSTIDLRNRRYSSVPADKMPGPDCNCAGGQCNCGSSCNCGSGCKCKASGGGGGGSSCCGSKGDKK
ncbi:Hypothetical protein NTJ_15199 [Nesidiocoris tenuis]|uniref:Metallothionein n=1 Tax=Nesidiocoris tenuis TaxID=355587 RepID=A0ABN7BDC0_9HEMI|nr:Hypothetical protein NTJ_15199 [Nesidiocoris tenuis]